MHSARMLILGVTVPLVLTVVERRGVQPPDPLA